MSPAAPPAALAAALAELATRVPPERIDRVWLFPARSVGGAESTLAVLALYALEGPADRRDVLTLRSTSTLEHGRLRRTYELVEQGSAPVEHLERVIVGVLRRLKDEREVPRSEPIDGDPARWHALLTGGSGRP